MHVSDTVFIQITHTWLPVVLLTLLHFEHLVYLWTDFQNSLGSKTVAENSGGWSIYMEGTKSGKDSPETSFLH